MGFREGTTLCSTDCVNDLERHVANESMSFGLVRYTNW